MSKRLPIFVALALLAGPASAAEGVKVSLVGKTPEAIKTDIAKAARTVCIRAHAAHSLGYYLTSACVRETIRDAEAAIGMTTAKAAPDKLASAR